jgi:hypothetical protein
VRKAVRKCQQSRNKQSIGVKSEENDLETAYSKQERQLLSNRKTLEAARILAYEMDDIS